jgi:hypothetical protein
MVGGIRIEEGWDEVPWETWLNSEIFILLSLEYQTRRGTHLT